MQAQDRLASALERVADAVERATPRELPPLVRCDRPTDAVGLQVPRRLPVTSFLSAIPGLAAQFERQVPREHLQREDGALVVRCTCGASTRLDGALRRCAGGCWRFFLLAGPMLVMVAGPYPQDANEPAAAA